MFSHSSTSTTVFEQSNMHQQPASQAETDAQHIQHMQQTRYTEEQLDELETQRAVFLTNLPRHLDRERIFTTLSQITQREVKKFDLPNQSRINGEFNKGFAYLHLKSDYRTRVLLKKKFIRLGGNKCLIHPYRDHRQENVLPRDAFKVTASVKNEYQYNNEEMMRNRINTGDSGVVWCTFSPPLGKQKKHENIKQMEKIEIMATQETTQNTPPSTTRKSAFQDLVIDLQSNPQTTLQTKTQQSEQKISISPSNAPEPLDDTSSLKYMFARFTPIQRTVFYEEFSKDKIKNLTEQKIQPVEESETYEKMVQHYLDIYKEISTDHKLWTSELQTFANINGFSFDYVVGILKQHKRRTVQR